MKRKGIKIKERVVDVPLTVDQVYWYQYKSIIKAEIEKCEKLNHLELVIAIFGEDRDFWRGLPNANEFLNFSSDLYRIYLQLGERNNRAALIDVLASEIINDKVKKPPFFKRLFKKKKNRNGILHTEIKVEDKIYHAPENLEWQPTALYMDGSEVTSLIHSETDNFLILEAYERLFKIFFYTIITGKEYSPEAALNMDIDRVRWRDVLDFGGFFLLRLNAYQNNILKELPTSNIQSMKLKPVLMK